MIDIKELRKVIADCYWPISPVTINEILDRLEAAEKERDDAKAAAENIALKLDYLRSKFETAKNAQNDWLRANAPGGWIDNLRIENEALHAKVEQMERQELGFRERCTPSSPTGYSNRFPRYVLPRRTRRREMPYEFVWDDRYIVFKLSDVVEHLTTAERRHLERLYEIQRVGRKEAGKSELECVVVEKDWPEYEPTWRAIEARVTGAQPAPSVPEGWLRAIDEALVTAHIGVADENDTYEQAKAKLDNLIGFFVDVATDPAVNGGWKLVPIEPTSEMLGAGEDTFVTTYTGTPVSAPIDVYRAMLAAAPEAKP